MSETIKPIEVTRRVQENTARAGQSATEATGAAALRTQAAIEAVGRAAKDSISQTEHAAEAVSAASSKAAAAEQALLMTGVRTVADAGGKIADSTINRGHHLLASAVQAMDIYTDATERSAERVQALVSSCMAMGRGVQKMQHAWLQMIERSVDTAARRPQDLLQCKNLVEVAKVQRDLYTDAVNRAFESSSRMLELASNTAQEAFEPLQAQHR